ncbi:MAG: heat-inducible transcription repressor HrcA [Mollicutes bacterium]|nr:heat-inducible transcription repressor HrcA [Mollicutes bacterium]
MDERSRKILKAIVEHYVKTVKPVGSKSLCKKFKLSSATIRNEMAELEKLGYIEKSHISSGRTPSKLGYEYYVENLMEPEKLTGTDVLKLQTIVNNKSLVLSDTISKCMEIISELTNYASVVLGSSAQENYLQQVNIIPIDDFKIVALVCTNRGIVENKKFNLDENTNIKELIKTSEIINKLLVGTPINEVSSRLEYEIKPIISKQLQDYETVYNIFYNAFSDFASDTKREMQVVGKTKILEQPEYSDATTIKRIACKLEDEEFIRSVVEDKDSEEIKVYIGEDSEVDENTTVIRRKYNINGEKGTIAIIGPKRMEYGKVFGLLNYVLDEVKKKDDTK